MIDWRLGEGEVAQKEGLLMMDLEQQSGISSQKSVRRESRNKFSFGISVK